MKTVKLLDLLKLNICQQCPSSFKRPTNRVLMCGWEEKPEFNKSFPPCIKVPQCGNWPEYFNDETFEQIRIPVGFRK